MSDLVAGISPKKFLRDHWQKKPLLVRQAFPDFQGFVDKEAMFELATRSDALARLVIENPKKKRGSAGRWELHEGPFAEPIVDADLPADHWTLLVQSVESLLPGGWELLRAFSFLPAARVDDLMISYASAYGSVGPHEDLYDVFLLQAGGRRRWRIDGRTDRSYEDRAVDDNAPIKILKSFTTEEEFVLDPGDMLYLPPGVAHWGEALEPCFTYSIGFVAPSHEALVQNFLVYLGQRLEGAHGMSTMYADPRLQVPADPMQLGDDMVRATRRLFSAIKWSPADVEDFLGRLLTGPKPHVVFPIPARQLSLAQLDKMLRQKGSLRLSLPSRGLMKGRRAFLNGDAQTLASRDASILRELFAMRSVALPLTTSDALTSLLHAWHTSGFLTFHR